MPGSSFIDGVQGIKELSYVGINLIIQQVFEKYMGGGTLGFDKEDSPVMLDPFGKRDVRGKKQCNNLQTLSMNISLTVRFGGITFNRTI